MRRTIFFLLLGLPIVPVYTSVVASPPASAKPAPDVAFDKLLDLMQDRLDVMHDVARWKWGAKSPIEDPKREAALLDDVAKRGKALDLDPAITRAFFKAQIEAAKIVQKADFQRWETRKQGPEGEAPDLTGVLRPRIDRLNRDLLTALSQALPRLRSGDGARDQFRVRAEKILTGDGIDSVVRSTAIRSLVDPVK